MFHADIQLERAPVLTHRDQVPEVLQGHVSVQHPLGRVQQTQLLLCEDHSHVLERHDLLQHQTQSTSISQPASPGIRAALSGQGAWTGSYSGL